MIHLVGTRLALEIGGREPAAPSYPGQQMDRPAQRGLEFRVARRMRARSDTVVALIAAQTGGGLLPRLALARIVAVSSGRWESVR